MVFQSYALYPHMSVYDNLAFGLKLRKVPQGRDIEQRVGEAADILELEQPARPQAQGSSPAASGSAWPWAGPSSASRAVFLMDEPLSNLDAKLRVADARRDRAAAPAPRHHHRLRHPRPGRGDDDGRPHRGA